MGDFTNKTDAQLVREWNDCERTCRNSDDASERQRAHDRQLEIEREQTDRMIQKMKGANRG